jgi:hypothetical protein
MKALKVRADVGNIPNNRPLCGGSLKPTLVLFIMPDWLTSEKYLTLATWGLVSVTLLLVVATGFLYLDGLSKSKEQRVHWKGETRLRIEETKPKSFVEIARKQSAPGVFFQCFNLGNSTFIVDELIVIIEETSTTATFPLEGPPVLLPGRYTYVSFDCARFLDSAGGKFQASATFTLTGSAGKAKTAPVSFYFRNSPGEMKLYSWSVGCHRDIRSGMLTVQPRTISDEVVAEEAWKSKPTVIANGLEFSL